MQANNNKTTIIYSVRLTDVILELMRFPQAQDVSLSVSNELFFAPSLPTKLLCAKYFSTTSHLKSYETQREHICLLATFECVTFHKMRRNSLYSGVYKKMRNGLCAFLCALSYNVPHAIPNAMSSVKHMNMIILLCLRFDSHAFILFCVYSHTVHISYELSDA